MRASTIVVTGAAGFIGSNLAARLLAEGYRVVGIDDLSQGRIERVPQGVEMHVHDIRDAGLESIFTGADAVFHLAAKNCIADCQADPLTTFSVNVLGTVGVFEAARRSGVRRVIHAETSALYEGISALPTAEHDVAPQSVYAVSKLSAAALAETYVRFHGMQVTGLRYFCVYGPHQDDRRTVPPVMTAFITHLLNGSRPVIFGSGEKRRDFVHVDDVNDFHVLCLRNEATIGRSFNLGSGESHSVREVLDRIARLLGVEAAPEYAPDRPAEAHESRADTRAAQALGWRSRVSLDEGLAAMIDFICAQRQVERRVQRA